MTNRINLDKNESIIIPLEDFSQGNDRRGVLLSVPKDLTPEEINKITEVCGWHVSDNQQENKIDETERDLHSA